MPVSFLSLASQPQIIDYPAIKEEIASIKKVAAGDPVSEYRAVSLVLKQTVLKGREVIAEALNRRPHQGRIAALSYAYLTDQIIQLALYAMVGDDEKATDNLVILAVGGYGRGEMALHSDVDIAFLSRRSPRKAQKKLIESLISLLWDVGLRVSQSHRSLSDMVKMAKKDITIRTALLESRYLVGDKALFEEASTRFIQKVVAGSGRDFVAAKLLEWDERHLARGDSRYLVEPHLKEGKGGLRDLQSLFWIAKYLYLEKEARHTVLTSPILTDYALVKADLIAGHEAKRFRRCENFLWAVRCHLHILVKRPEERLNFDVQRSLAEKMGYRSKSGKSAVERFMHHYFLVTKMVGNLAALFIDALKVNHYLKPKSRRSGASKQIDGFPVIQGEIVLDDDFFFRHNPAALITLFAVAYRHRLDIHPLTLRQAGRDARLIDEALQNNPVCSAAFLTLFTLPYNPAPILKIMNNTGVLGRFIPDFGRIVAQMQFDMYHHYTVDEHAIRALDILWQIENNKLEDLYPLGSRLFKQLNARLVLYMALFLHDIAKGREGSHSALGAEIALRLCPRFGLTAAETKLVAWLVKNHLLMSHTAFQRDLADAKTITDFANAVKSPERLRLLYLLTVADISAVGPHIWNSWKNQLLTSLYEACSQCLLEGPTGHGAGRRQRIENRQNDVSEKLDWDNDLFHALVKRLPDDYWFSERTDVIAANMQQIIDTDSKGQSISVRGHEMPAYDATMISLYAIDHPGFFYRISGAIHATGGNILDARIHTTRDGMAMDNLLVQNSQGGMIKSGEHLNRMMQAIEDAATSHIRSSNKLAALRPPLFWRGKAFHVEPLVFIDNQASDRFTVIEVNAQDRPALLHDLGCALFNARLTISSAHIATYGERAVDVFYVSDLFSHKITNQNRLKAIEKRLLAAADAARISEK
ncbi:[protein-PII] uridylyltransferase [Zymomonas mobilis]|uniref:[protein-PII] uridylyltransferase n=1 Tax=Zymomonas mobilis TaxID=542 RepID=UPI0039E88BD9